MTIRMSDPVHLVSTTLSLWRALHERTGTLSLFPLPEWTGGKGGFETRPYVQVGGPGQLSFQSERNAQPPQAPFGRLRTGFTLFRETEATFLHSKGTQDDKPNLTER